MNVANFGSYLFNVLAARMLGPVGYGEVVAMITVLTLLNVPINVLTTVVTRFVAADAAHTDKGKISALLHWFEKRLYPLAALVSVVFVLSAFVIADFLNIRSVWTVIGIVGAVCAAFGLPVVRGGLQGVQRFFALSGSFLADTLGRLGAGLGLIAAGLGATGGVLGLSIGAVFSFIVGRFYLMRGLPAPTKKSFSGQELFRFGVPTLIGLGAVTALGFTDVIFVKHALAPEAAGMYGALATIGHIPLYLSMPIMGALQPIAATAEREGKNLLPIFLGGFGMTLAASGIIVLGFSLWPSLVIQFLYGEPFRAAAPYLGQYSLAMLFVTLSTMTTMYLLAINRTRFVWPLLVIALAQIILYTTSAQGFAQFLTILTYSSAAALAVQLPFALWGTRSPR
jgi:O-antigen/teichoic acid export membrane protein